PGEDTAADGEYIRQPDDDGLGVFIETLECLHGVVATAAWSPAYFEPPLTKPRGMYTMTQTPMRLREAIAAAEMALQPQRTLRRRRRRRRRILTKTAVAT
ncbi:hypothetical protein FRB98_006284, partial [Tulasnella sp. 332]